MKRRSSQLPPYTHRFRDRHGVWRSAFRRGTVRVPLPLPLLSAEWWEAYRTALADDIAGRETRQRSAIGAERTKPGSVASAFAAYTGSAIFKNDLAGSTQRWHFNILAHWRDDWGDRRLAHLQRRHVHSAVEQYAATPAQAAKFLKALRRMMQYCTSIGLIDNDPTQGVKPPRHEETNYRAWTDEELAKFRRRHQPGSTARTALELLLGTAQRPSDVVRMGRQHVRGDMIHVRQQKRPRPGTPPWEGDIPMTPELAQALAVLPAGNLTFLVTAYGAAFSVDGFRNKFREWCNQAGLPQDCKAHGLRDTALVILAEAGCTPHEIQAISGHKSLSEVQRYTKGVDQRALARAARAKTRTEIGVPASGDSKNGS
jgi:integrase